MNKISTHVLDLSAGKPAAGIAVRLEKQEDGSWSLIAFGSTDGDGRCPGLFVTDSLRGGVYRLTFATASYYAEVGDAAFYPEVTVSFTAAAGTSYHIPLLLSPFGYSTYRGS